MGHDVDSDWIYARDLDGTGSMHACSREDPGAVEYVRAELADALADLVQELIETTAGDPVSGTEWDEAALAALAAYRESR